MATTTLNAEQIAEAKRFIAAEAKESIAAEDRKIGAVLKAAAERVAAEARGCPGVVSAEVEKGGFYFNAIGVKVKFADAPAYCGGYYLVLKLDGYTHDRPIKLSAKVKAGYKSGVRTFKSVRSAVRGMHAFGHEIWASVAAWSAAEAVKKGE